MRPWLHILYFGLTPILRGCSPACVTTFLAQVHDPAGITFAVVRTDCDLIAKDSAVSITAIRDNEQGSTLLLKYDPWTDDLPHVHVGSDDTIFIHVSKASSVLEQHLTFGSFKVKVTIDKLAYPDRGSTNDKAAIGD